MKSNGISTNLGRIAVMIGDRSCGTDAISEDGLETILRELGVVRQQKDYTEKLLTYGYLVYDPEARMYRLTPEGKSQCTITVTVLPCLNAEEVRRHLVESLASYYPVIGIGEAEHVTAPTMDKILLRRDPSENRSPPLGHMAAKQLTRDGYTLTGVADGILIEPKTEETK